MKNLPIFALGALMGAGVVSFAQEATTGTIVARDAAPIRVSPNGKARVKVLATGQEAFLGLLELDAGAAVPLHRDTTEEYIYVLEGSGVMHLDGQTLSVKPGSAVYMPANAEVSFQNGEAPTRVRQIFADPDPASKFDAWASATP